MAEVERQMVESLCRIGEEAITLAKQIPPERGFHDRTGNLRSSMGYVVCKDGKPINIAFNAILGGNEGAKTGQKLAETLAQNKEGYVLIVVAGMKYAVYVEALGRDVLTTAEKFSEKRITKEMQDLVKNINDAFK